MKNIPLLICVLGWVLAGCQGNQQSRYKHNTMAMNMRMCHDQQPAVNMDKDLPIFNPSKRTYTNTINIIHADNIYVRYNTSMRYQDSLRNFYLTALPQNGWNINHKKSSQNKIAVQKGQRYASIRFFEMKQKDTLSLAFSINLVKPKDAE